MASPLFNISWNDKKWFKDEKIFVENFRQNLKKEYDNNNNSLIFLSPSYIKKLNAKLFKIC